MHRTPAYAGQKDAANHLRLREMRSQKDFPPWHQVQSSRVRFQTSGNPARLVASISDPHDGLPMTAARFFNRELSWLEFNQRVMDEARDATIPLLERLKF